MMLPSLTQAHRHSGWFCCQENLMKLANRLKAGECAVVGWRPPTPDVGFSDEAFGVVTDFPERTRLWCLTHGVPEDYGHHKDRQEVARGRANG